jgi:hypothetical protein
MSGRELDPDGTDSYHPEHPWESCGHRKYIQPSERTKANWPPERSQAVGWHEEYIWDALPDAPAITSKRRWFGFQ